MFATTQSVPGLFRLLMLLAATLLLSAGAVAQDSQSSHDAELDRLFAELRVAPDPATAQRIDRRIWMYWLSPADPDLARKMEEALQARRFGDYGNAIRLLTDMISDYPHYAEAWNQRATIYFFMRNFEASVADCAKVLELEPRHFGALSGRALNYLQLDKRALALKDMIKALEIHPFLNERYLFPELSQEMTRT